MHILTKQQKIENVEELIQSKERKVSNLNKEIESLRKKLKDLKEPKELSGNQQGLLDEYRSLHREEGTKPQL